MDCMVEARGVHKVAAADAVQLGPMQVQRDMVACLQRRGKGAVIIWWHADKSDNGAMAMMIREVIRELDVDGKLALRAGSDAALRS